MKQATVVVIGGGATGTGILRDLAMRGIPSVLVEMGDLAHGTSSRFHGLLHSGARYAVGDPEAARECITENTILRRIGSSCVEQTEGYFVLTPEDDPAFEPVWHSACLACGISAEQISVEEAIRREPNINPRALAVYRVPDSAVDGFRLVWQNAMSARRYGADVLTYRKVVGFDREKDRVKAVRLLNTRSGQEEILACDFVINATGSWTGDVAHLAGIGVSVAPDRGTLLAFNHRFVDRVINRLRKSSDGDIFVPHGSITIFGTTSVPTDRADDTLPRSEEVLQLLDIGEALIPNVKNFRLLRAFAGTRPLYSPDASTGRSATRNFVIIDHATEDLANMVSITGGKFTSFRLMAEKTVDTVAKRLGVSAPCRTADEAIIPEPDAALAKRARAVFPAAWFDLAVSRLGDRLDETVKSAEEAPWKKLLLCECELVTMAEFETVAAEPTSYSLGDIRRRTRLGMGTCQGSFCALRATDALVEAGLIRDAEPCAVFQQFLQERWQGIRPLLWGQQLREVELQRGIYGATLNVDGLCAKPNIHPGAEEAPVCAMPDTGQPTDFETKAWDWSEPSCEDIPHVSPTEQNYDVVVVGAGLAGLTAAAAALRRGLKVHLIHQGGGALSIGGGTVDLLGYVGADAVDGDPFSAISSLPANHPYRLVGADTVRESVRFLASLAQEAGYAFIQAGNENGNAWMPTAAGTLKPTWLTGPGMDPEVFARAASFQVIGVTGLKDFSAMMAARGLSSNEKLAGKRLSHASIPSPLLLAESGERDTTTLDLARWVDKPEGFAWLVHEIRKVRDDSEALLLPAICGTRPDPALHAALEEELGVPVIELFCPPPSVTGLRLWSIMRSALDSGRMTFAEAATATGAIVRDGRCEAILAGGAGNRKMYRASSFIIATGGIFSRGVNTGPGEAREAIFNLPVAAPVKQEDWSCASFFGRQGHPFARLGVAVDASLRAVDPSGKPVMENVYFVGRTLAGYDFATEKSGSGVALATGYAAGMKA